MRRAARAAVVSEAVGSRAAVPEHSHTHFAAAFAPTALAGERAAATIPQGWSQGRATFGGLVLAAAVAAARSALAEPRPCRAVVASFPAPVGPGEVELQVRVLRHGRAVSSLQVELRQGAELGCVALTSFGRARASSVAVPPPPRPAVPKPEDLPPLLGAVPGGLSAAPQFTQYFDYRVAFGAPPYSGADVREIGGWCRFRGEPGPLGEEHVLALVDAWPSPAVSRMVAPAPAASMTWSLELLEIEPEVAPDGWWLYRADLEAAAGGYAHAAARLWSPAGRLAALSRQAVAIFG
jgi:acyl-CoA thioesterase